MELRGKVILDEETIEELKKSVREEVLEDIKREGLFHNEVKRYMKNLPISTYLNMILQTISGPIKDGEKKEKEDDFHFDDKKQYDIICMIKTVLGIGGYYVPKEDEEE